MENNANPQRKPRFILTLSLFFLQLSLALAQSNPSTEPLAKADKMPTFPGGEMALKEYIDFNLGYISEPPTGVDQHVITRFVVSREGLIQDVEIVQGISETLNRKALTLINNMPRWTVGQQNNQAVPVRIELPIRFVVPVPTAKPAQSESTNAIPSSAGVQNPAKDSIPVYKVVERMPSFPEGQAALLRYLDQNLEYPKIAKENGVQGMVVVQMIVERDGTLSNVQVVRGIGAGCDEEATRLVKLMPKWVSGMQRDKAVRVQFNLPIRFKLE